MVRQIIPKRGKSKLNPGNGSGCKGNGGSNGRGFTVRQVARMVKQPLPMESADASPQPRRRFMSRALARVNVTRTTRPPPPTNAAREASAAARQARGGGVRTTVTRASIRIMARTGMLPLDFMTVVYRNELYEDYDQHVAEDGRTLFWSPRPGADRIQVDYMTRLSAAVAAARYVHKPMPVGVEVAGRNAVALTVDKLKRLSTPELEEWLRLMDKAGVEVDLAAAMGTTVDQEGQLLLGAAP